MKLDKINIIVFIFYCLLNYGESACLNQSFFHLDTINEPVIYQYSTNSILNFVYPQFNRQCGQFSTYDIEYTQIHSSCPGSSIDVTKEKDDQFKCTNCYLEKVKFSPFEAVYLNGCSKKLAISRGLKCLNNVIPIIKPFEDNLFSVGYQISSIDFLKTYDIIDSFNFYGKGLITRVKIDRIITKKFINNNTGSFSFVKGSIVKQLEGKYISDIDKIFGRSYQIQKFQEVVTDDVVKKYFSDNNYLVPGQSVSKNDLYYRTQERATFFYENTFPMWRTIEEGNWKLIGDIIRRRIIETDRELLIFVMPYDVLTINGSEPLKIQTNDKLDKILRIPQIVVKVVVDPLNTSRGIVFHTFNDPYINIDEAKDKMSQLCIKGIQDCGDENGEFSIVKNGLTFCCDLQANNSQIWMHIKKFGFIE